MEETDVKGEEYVQEHIADGADDKRRSPSLSSLPSSPSWVPSPLSTVSSPYSQNVLPSRLAWSPSGDLLAVASDDARVRLFPVTDNLTFGAQTLMKEGEWVYDMCWSPVDTNSLVVTGRYQPVHLWSTEEDGSASIAATYKCINALDELSHAFSVAVSQDGESIYCGLKGEIRQFDRALPGRQSWTYNLEGQGGIISSIDVHPSMPVLAAGCYNKTSGLYSSDGQLLCLLTGQAGGVTQVLFSKDGSVLYTGARKDGEIIGWDLRQPGKVLFTAEREVATNQRIQLCNSPCGRFLLSASTDGSVRVWDTSQAPDPQTGLLLPHRAWLLHGDAVTGVDWRSNGDVIATCSGQRRFPDVSHDEQQEEEEDWRGESCVRLWDMR